MGVKMNIYNTFESLKPKKFVDRSEFFNLIENEMRLYGNSKSYCKAIAIYGMGGIGKSRFLKELHNELKDNIDKEKYFLTYSNLEIDNKNELYSFIRIRKQILKPCYLFDYAIVSLSEKCFIEKIDDDYINVLRTNIFTSLVSLIQEGIGNFYPSGLELNGTIEFINELILKGKKYYTSKKYKNLIDILNDLIDISPKKLIELLPILLGFDIKQHYSNKKIIFMIDSFDTYKFNWIEKLIDAIGFGLFIITSREKLAWEHLNCVDTFHMEEIPLNEAKKYLREYISQEESVLINQILCATECIPIYLDLAISTYLKKDSLIQNPIYNELSFKSKADIIKNFLDHLNREEQNTILVLSIIDIFDEQIFDYLVSELNLPISKTQYNNFCEISIIDSFKDVNDIKMFHNVFHVNISELTDYETKYKIFTSYLTFISYRGIFIYKIDTLFVLFDNIIHLIQLNNFVLSTKDIERILDIFFVLYESNVSYEIKGQDVKTNGVLLKFIEAVQFFRKDINSSLKLFKQIDGKENALGKHKNSYYAIFYYVKSISGKYKTAEKGLSKFNNSLAQASILDWYYGKIKIYYNDILMLKGFFKKSIIGFEDYQREIEPYEEIKSGDIYETSKQVGHCYRFNFLLDEANTIYYSLLDDYQSITTLKSYSLTALCETNCYFNPDYVIENYHSILKLTKSVGQMRSYAKVLYSLGIAMLRKGKLECARNSIEESIKINNEVGYKSGELFGLIAKSYYLYSKEGNLSNVWVKKLENVIRELDVYGYLMLPIYIIIGDDKKIKGIKEKYEWIDWNYTYENYKKFISLL